MAGRKTYTGTFIPKHPKKYVGDPTKIVFRSSWERAFMKYCDLNPNVVNWSSEEVIVNYIDSGSGKARRYFPDFVIRVDNSQTIDTIMIEVKPFAETQPPQPPKRMTQKSQNRLIEATQTFATNTSKWKAATEYCRKKGWKFMIITEKELFGK